MGIDLFVCIYTISMLWDAFALVVMFPLLKVGESHECDLRHGGGYGGR